MNITVYTAFSKRKNSTKQPTGGTSVTCSIKHTNSMRNPIFNINKDDLTGGVVPENIRYVKDTDHSICYFVNDVEYVPNKYYALTCTIDPMATYKSSITGSTQFVLYSASIYNTKLTDPRIQLFPNVTGYSYSATIPFLDATGFYVVTVINYDSNNVSTSGITTTYLMDIAVLRSFAGYINVDLASILDPSLNIIEVLRSLASGPMDFVVSIRYIPLDLQSVATELNLGLVDVYLGPSQAAHSGTPVQGYLLGDSSVITIEDKLELSALFSADFRCSPTYLKLHAYIPGFGQVDLDPVACKFGFKVDCHIDVLTGDVTTLLYGYPTTYNSSPLLQNSYNYNIGIILPIAKYASDAGSVVAGIGGAMSLADRIIAGNASLIGTALEAAASANSIAQGIKPSGSVKGSISGKSFVAEKFLRLEVEQSYTQDLDIMTTTHGRPLMQEVALSTLSGFCQCANASVSINGFEADRDIINGYLESGFYLE